MPTDLGTFIGRFHPLLVHLPIGFLLITVVVELLSQTRRHAGVERLMPFLLALCAVSALLSVVTGLLLAPHGGYDHTLVWQHQTLGIGLAAATALAWGAAHLQAWRPSRAARAAYRTLLVTSILLLGATGHLGGSLTHGDTYLTEHMPVLPWFTRTEAQRAPLDPSTTPVFATLVAPTLHASCVPCHGPARAEGRLRLDTPEGLRKGGESGAVIVPGLSARSEIVRRLLLPPSHADAMPPRGHRPPSHAEAALLRWWIDQGASFDQTLADAEIRPELEPAIAAVLGPVDFSAPAILSVRVPAADPAAIARVRALPLRVEPLAAGTSLLQVQAVPASRGLGDTDLQALLPLAQQITWLDLGGTRVTDTGLTGLLPRLPNLSRLSLDRTAITDAVLVHLVTLTRLEALNVYGTTITDAGLKPLASLPRLRSVYAWQTAVTAAGAEALEAAAPRVTVNLGAEPAGATAQAGGTGTPTPKPGTSRKPETSR